MEVLAELNELKGQMDETRRSLDGSELFDLVHLLVSKTLELRRFDWGEIKFIWVYSLFRA